MKGFIIGTITTFITMIVVIFIIFPYVSKKEVTNNKVNNNMLSMMVENDKGEYEPLKNNKWPEGYILNEDLSKCEKGSKLIWNNDTKTITLSTNKTDKCYVYFEKDNLGYRCKNKEIANCFIENYEVDGAIIYHNLEDATKKEITNASLVAGDDSYRYSGGNDIVHNYVCFGNECSSNPTDDNYQNLYRIIGIFKNEETKLYELKLIKADYTLKNELGDKNAYRDYYNNCENAGANNNYKGDKVNYYPKIVGYYWNTTNGVSSYYGQVVGTNNWDESNLNNDNLNDYFYNVYLGNENRKYWQQMIVDHSWISGGVAKSVIENDFTKNIYDKEIGAYKEQEFSKTKIGLLYISDYGYAAYSTAWQTFIGSGGYNTSNIPNNNWMYMGLYEWFITPDKDGVDRVFRLGAGGNVNGEHPMSFYGFAVRPTFYLSSSVKLLDGDGTKEKPYRLSL